MRSQVIDAIWNEWKEDYLSFTNIKTKEDLQSDLENTQIYILKHNNTLCSFCLIEANDMNVRPDVGPWLSSVFTFPQERNKGYARHLVEYVSRLHTPQLYLWCTPDLESFYKSFGFENDTTIYNHGQYKTIYIMVKK